MDINTLIDFAVKNSASDLHITTNNTPKLRLKGDIVPVKYAALSAEEVSSMLASIMTDIEKKDFAENLELDFAIQTNNYRFRVNAFNTIAGPAAVFRLIPSDVLTLEDLNAFFDESIKGESYNVMVIGNKKDLDFGALSKLGKIEELDIDYLFNYEKPEDAKL